ncbi:MAG: thioredoxin family protein [Spirochaetales bacterium]|nr:thioredoxin family protein [Spirochaetales bacterium]
MDFLLSGIENFARQSLATPGIALPAYFLAGLASAAFPCVYPLIPLTAAYMQKRSQAETGKRVRHPLVYWSGMVLSYLVLGTIASLSGGAFNLFMQSGAVILATGMLFLFLGYVMIDFHPLELEIAARWTNDLKGRSGILPTLGMGLLSGLIASACVAPALTFMLIFIAEHSAGSGFSAGSILYGSALSGAFGLGIGLPFFLAGILGSRLPGSGFWMNLIKWAFAIIIFIFSFSQLQKGFLTVGFHPFETKNILAGIGLILASTLLGLQPAHLEDRPRLTRFTFALLFLLLGAAAIWRGFQPPVSTPGIEQTESIGPLVFHRDAEEARAESLRLQRPLFIDFYADWCANCKEFSAMMETDKDLQTALKKVVLLKVYDTDEDFKNFRTRHRELTIGLPFFLLLDRDGRTLWKSQSLSEIPELMRTIHRESL